MIQIELWAITPQSELLIERTGRVCWRTELSAKEDGTATFIRKLIKRGHLSVIEHATATFCISGVSRACSHQLVRHRIASYSQESQRHVDTSHFVSVLPQSINENMEALALFASIEMACKVGYRALRDLGIPKEDARFILPNATPTRIVVTMNFRSWRHFIEMRCNKAAQWEIRAAAKRILEILYNEAPSVFEDLFQQYIGGDSDGTNEVKPQ